MPVVVRFAIATMPLAGRIAVLTHSKGKRRLRRHERVQMIQPPLTRRSRFFSPQMQRTSQGVE
jgi:hypothetical protein